MIDRLFYIVYNSYYKHGKYKNDIPPLTVFGIFCVATFSILISIAYAIYLLKDPTYFRTHRAPSKTIYFISAALITYLLFYYKKRYKSIYDKFKDIEHYDTFKGKFIAFFIMVLIIISPIVFMLIYNKLYFGAWV